MGLVRTWPASGKANAQRSSSFGTSSALSPASSVGWKPVPSRFPANPIDRMARKSGAAHPRPAQKAVSGRAPALYARPVRYSASPTRCSGVRADPSACIVPFSIEATIACGDSVRSIATPGVRASPTSLWQEAHAFSNSAASAALSGCCAAQAAAPRTDPATTRAGTAANVREPFM